MPSPIKGGTIHAKSSFGFTGLNNVLILTLSCTVHGFENVTYTVREREEAEEPLGQDRVETAVKLNVKGTSIVGPALAIIGRITSEAGPGTGQSLLHGQHLYIAH